MGLTITTLIENSPDDPGRLKYEHGLSLYIEMKDSRGETVKALFDTGLAMPDSWEKPWTI